MKSLFIILTILTSTAYAGWQIVTVDDCTGWISLTLDSTNNPHISYVLDYQTLIYAYRDNSVFLIDTVIQGGNNFLYTSLALNSHGDAHIICVEVSSGYPGWLCYVYWDGSDWQTGEPLPPPSIFSYYPSFQLNSSDYPCLSYRTYGHSLGYATWDGAEWQCEEVDTVADVWYTTSLKLDSSGNPHISYYDNTNDDLKYAYWDGFVWHLEVVDSEGSVGQYTSLELDSSGYPHISYFDDSNDDLKYAYWDGFVWHLEVVDSEGSVGEYTSMELDPTDHAHISYLDSTKDDLMYAYKYDTGIESPNNVEGCYLLPLSPNPSSGTFAVEFTIHENAVVGLCIYDVTGRLVVQTSPSEYEPGLNEVDFTDLDTGVYFCRMISGEFAATQRFVVIN